MLDGPNDELAQLGRTFNGLLARLEASFDAQRQFVANASHELRTPLARQRTLIEVALGDPDATVQSLRATHARVLAAGEEQERLIEALLTLARSERGLDHRQRVDLAGVTADVLAARRAAAEAAGLRLEATVEPAVVAGDPRLVERLAANLVDNAIKHNVPGGHLHVATATIAGHPTLSVQNAGPVIEPAEVERLLQPFQRLDSARAAQRDGLGLGLSIAQAIATTHAARLVATAPRSGGLRVEVRFPPAGVGRDRGDRGDRAGARSRNGEAAAPMPPNARAARADLPTAG